MDADAQAILDFWLGSGTTAPSAPHPDKTLRKRWFATDATLDDLIRQRFGHLLSRLRTGQLEGWRTTPAGTAAYVILGDQFTRNACRGTRDAFAHDDQTLAAARRAVEDGFDQQLSLAARSFLYIAFTHSEGVLDQHLGVGLTTALVEAADDGYRETAEGNLRFARWHRDIIMRFGRFPHRNTALGRASTPEEIAYLRDAHTFGQ